MIIEMTTKGLNKFLLSIIIVFLIAGSVSAKTVPLTVEAYKNQQITNTLKEDTFWVFDLPVINNEGKISFLAKVNDPEKASTDPDEFYSSY